MANTHSIVFNGSTQSAYANSALINPQGTFSIEMWVKCNAEITSGEWQFMYCENSTTDWVGYLEYRYNGGTRQIVGKASRWVVIGYESVYAVDLGTDWHHIAYTKNSSAGTLYLDGVQVGNITSPTDTDNGDTNVGNEFMIGKGQTEATSTNINWFPGQIDDVRVWSDIRTAQEISDNMYPELVGDETGLTHYWKLNNNTTATTGTSLTAEGTPTYSSDVPTRPVASGDTQGYFLI